METNKAVLITYTKAVEKKKILTRLKIYGHHDLERSASNFISVISNQGDQEELGCTVVSFVLNIW